MPAELSGLRSPLLRFFACAEAREVSQARLVHDATGARTYASIAEGARRSAGALGPLHGARVALLVSSGAAFVEAFFGVLAAGGCVVVLSPLHPHAETAYFCADA